jgi:hypothetical protein
MAFMDNASVNVKIKTWQLSQAWKGQQDDPILSEGTPQEQLTSLNQIFV